MFKAGELIGCSVAGFERTYAHYCPDFQHAAALSAVFPAEAGARPLACGAKWQLSYCKIMVVDGGRVELCSVSKLDLQ